MAYDVIYCDDCKVLLFDPEVTIVETKKFGKVIAIKCPVCGTTKRGVRVKDLSDL